MRGETKLTIAANHMSMCRFSSSDDQGYRRILEGIRIVTSKIRKQLEKAELADGEDGGARYKLTPFDFRVRGVTSISCDTHKVWHALAAQFSNLELRGMLFFA